MFTRLHLTQPPTTKKVIELAVDGFLGRWMAGRNWAGTTIPFPFVIVILYWMPADPLMPYYRVHEFTHVQQDEDAKWWFKSWFHYGLQMLKNFPFKKVLTRKLSISQAAFDDYKANPYEVAAYAVEDNAFKNGLPTWAKPPVTQP